MNSHLLRLAFCGPCSLHPSISPFAKSSISTTFLSPTPPLFASKRIRRSCLSKHGKVRITALVEDKPCAQIPDSGEGQNVEDSTSDDCVRATSSASEEANDSVFFNTPTVKAALGTLVLLGVFFSTPEASVASMMATLDTVLNGPIWIVSLSLGISAFVQSVTGFGFAITCVGALTQLPWIANSSMLNVVQPLAVTLGALTGWILLVPELNLVKWRSLTGLFIATTVATPLGIIGVDYVDGGFIIRALGVLVTSFVIYAVSGAQLPKQIGGKAGAYGFGMLAGALGGAFDMSGPALVIHAKAAGWDTATGEFRRNLLCVLTINSTLVLLLDSLTGRLDDYYYTDFVQYALPTVFLGIVAGKALAGRLNPAILSNLVLALCFIMGVRLLAQ